jgi:hypothetical protein
MIEPFPIQTPTQAEELDITAWMINPQEAKQEAIRIEEIENELQIRFVEE